jgi:hypothetical protein
MAVLLEERLPGYRGADLRVETGERPADAVALQIVAQLPSLP